MKKIKVGIIGCGTIGSALACALIREFRPRTSLSFLCDAHPERAAKLKQQLSPKAKVVSISQIIQRSDLIIEAASAVVSASVAREALKKNKQVLIMSVGGLLKEHHWKPLLNKSRGKLWIPSGAIAGIDGLLAAREKGISRVTLITRKPPAGLHQAPYFLKKKFPVLKGHQAVRVFRGSAQQAVHDFPQNINVAAILSLAGIGAQRTRVEIWTSSAYRVNQHEVTIEGKFGKIQSVTHNIPSKNNPKTSALAIFSAIATLRKIFSSVQIGS